MATDGTTGSGAGGGAGRLPWTMDVVLQLDNEGVEAYLADPGTRVAFTGALEAPTYVYVVQKDADDYVRVLYPADGAAVQFPAGPAVRVPAEGWARTVSAGVVRVIGAPGPVTRDQIAALAGGREPPPNADKHGSS
jgi:hypothetical protein